MTSFPIVLIPSDLESIKVAQPRHPLLSKHEPPTPLPAQIKQVPLPPQKINRSTFFKARLFTVFLSMCIAPMLNTIIAIVIMLCLLLVIQMTAYEDREIFPSRLIKARAEEKTIKESNSQERLRYKSDLERYEKDLSEYELALSNYQEELNTYLLPQTVRDFRENLLIEYFKRTGKSTIYHNQVRKGISENDLKSYLIKYFSINKINIDVFVQKHTNNRRMSTTCYFPDFTYVDKLSELCIDIEIDEPYTYIDRQPIHYIDTDKDRNTAFLSMRWIVIRFAEVQVVKYPDRCCKLIAETIHTYIPSEELVSQFSGTEDLPLVAQWNYNEALDMASNSYRTTYICSDKIKQEKKQSDNTNKDTTCRKCDGTGYIARFSHIERGRCFECT